MKQLMSAFKDYYAKSGRPAAVLGGGPSLPKDMERLPKNAVLIAVNYHALYLCEPDFMVYNDHPESDPILEAAVRDSKAIRVSPHPTSDVKFDVDVWTGFYSSNTATWFGLWMGCNPVILCGMDCYQGSRVYFHEYSHDSPAFHYPLEDQLRPWKEDGRHRLPNVERVRVMSGPLARVFKLYEDEDSLSAVRYPVSARSGEIASRPLQGAEAAGLAMTEAESVP